MDTTTTTRISRIDAIAQQIDRETPDDRDRVMDLLRVASMLVVALGHWIMAIVWVADDGGLRSASLLVEAPWTQWLTLVLQVMGLFFAVGGWASARSLRTPPASTTAWIHARVRRLLAPVTLYVAVVAAVVPAVAGAVGPDAVRVAESAFTIHLWFCAAVVPIYVLTPALHTAWRAYGPRLLVGLVVVALTVDGAHRILELPLVGWLNFVAVWGAATVLGFAWADGAIDRATARRMVVGGAIAVAALVSTPWMPLAMVGVDGAAHSNNLPPSTALVALTVVHVGVVVLARPLLDRLTRRPLVWAAVAFAGRGAVTVYLWHLLAMGLVIAGAYLAAPALLSGEPLSASWWLTRPMWLAALVVATAPLVALAVRLELRLGSVDAPSGWRVLAASALATVGCGALVVQGLSTTPAVVAVVLAAALGRWLPATSAS